LIKSNEGTFVMEMPPYRMPTLRNVLIYTLEKVKCFAIKAGTILLLASIVLWFLNNFTINFSGTTNPNESILANIGNIIAPIFSPLGFGEWRAATALLTGTAAKEIIVSTISVLYNATGQELPNVLSNYFTPLSAYSFMVFSLLYFPCLSTLIILKRELHSYKWFVFSIIYGFSVAYLVSFAIYNIGKLFI